MVSDDTHESLYSIDEARIVGADDWLETRLDHPEDVAVADDSTLYAGGEAGQLYRIRPTENDVTILAETGGFVLGVALSPDGDLYACDFQRHEVVRLPLNGDEPAGPLETVVSGGPGDPPWHPNYCAFDPGGRLYVSDSGDRSDMENAGGCIYAVDPGGTGRVVTDETSAFPNGLALARDGRTLFVAETGLHRVAAVQLEDGHATDVSIVTEAFGLVDGLAFDADERLYAASIGDNAVYRFADGTVERIVHDPNGLVIGNPTNIAFGGPEMHTMYIANLALHHVTAIDLDVAGRLPTGRMTA